MRYLIELHIAFGWGEVKIKRTHIQPCVIRNIPVTWNVYPVLPSEKLCR